MSRVKLKGMHVNFMKQNSILRKLGKGTVEMVVISNHTAMFKQQKFYLATQCKLQHTVP